MVAEDERWPKRARFWRSFVAGEAVDRERNYHCPWNNLETLREWVVQGKWVLITGPFQSGKSSLMYALSDAVVADGLLPVVTTLTEDMIYAANNPDLGQGQRDFFGKLALSIEDDSQGSLRIRPQDRELGADMGLVSGMFRSSEKEIVWFLDEASLLNDIIHPTILTTFLSGLRSCKQGARSKHKTGSYSLRSFVLVGTNRTRRLLAHDRGKCVYVTTGPLRVHDPYNPFTGTGSCSPLSVEETTGAKFLSKQDILQMLSDYAQERGIIFRTQVEEGDVTDDSRGLAIYKFAKNIHELTSGYKGMVGTCCTYICGKSIHTYSVWRQKVREGSVAKKVFTDKVYTKILSKVPSYGEELQKFVLECIQLGGKAAPPSTLDTLPAINDGVLKSVGGGYLALTSPLLLSAMLEDCYMAVMAPREALPPVATFDDAMRVAFTYIKPDRLSLEEVLNRNGQPSEYIWQSEFFLGLKFVLEHGYPVCATYKILVEAKGKHKDGKRTMRLDLFLKNSGSPKKGIDVQGAGNEDSIRSHIKRCDKYRELHGCEMHYVYFLVGEDKLGAMDVIARESLQVQGLQCWYVCYLTRSRRWTVGQYNQGGRNWDLRVLDVPNSYPEFLFQK